MDEHTKNNRDVVLMRVRLSQEQAWLILENLRGNHLCDTCRYDENLKIIPGTQCETQKLIEKFEKIVDGSARKQGQRGGIISTVKRRHKLSESKREGMNHMAKILSKQRKEYET